MAILKRTQPSAARPDEAAAAEFSAAHEAATAAEARARACWASMQADRDDDRLRARLDWPEALRERDRTELRLRVAKRQWMAAKAAALVPVEAEFRAKAQAILGELRAALEAAAPIAARYAHLVAAAEERLGSNQTAAPPHAAWPALYSPRPDLETSLLAHWTESCRQHGLL